MVRNEQTKLTATALNNVAVAFIVAGFVGLLVAYGFGVGSYGGAIAVVAAILGSSSASSYIWERGLYC